MSLTWVMCLAVAAAPVRYLALGDSFTAGTAVAATDAFPAQVATQLEAAGVPVVVENLAVAGFTTDDLLARELPRAAAFKPTLVTVAIGANDLVRQPGEERYRGQLRRIFAQVAKLHARVVVLPQPDWSVAPVARRFGTPEELRGQIERMNQILREEAQAVGAVYLDLWAGNVAASAQGHFAPDGLHPDATVYATWAKAIVAARGK